MRIPDYTPYTRCGLAEDGMTDLFGRLHTAGNGGMQSCEIILLHEGADLVGVHGFERVQQARGDALAADADAAQLMPVTVYCFMVSSYLLTVLIIYPHRVYVNPNFIFNL